MVIKLEWQANVCRFKSWTMLYFFLSENFLKFIVVGSNVTAGQLAVRSSRAPGEGLKWYSSREHVMLGCFVIFHPLYFLKVHNDADLNVASLKLSPQNQSYCL